MVLTTVVVVVVVVVVVAVVVFILNRPYYPTSSVHPVSVQILSPREILILSSQTVRQRKTTKRKNRDSKCQASEINASVPGYDNCVPP